MKKDVQSAWTVEAQSVDDDFYMDNTGTLEEIAKQNDPEYNLLKFCEELTELQEKLLKFHLKAEGYKPSKEDIAEELGDVFVRMVMFADPDEKLQELMGLRINYKAFKLIKNYNAKKYKNI